MKPYIVRVILPMLVSYNRLVNRFEIIFVRDFSILQQVNIFTGMKGERFVFE